jgi:ferredoxin
MKMMRIRVNETFCTGHARCSALAPAVYQVDDDGYNVLRGHESNCPPDLEDQARVGADNCPEQAIELLR